MEKERLIELVERCTRGDVAAAQELLTASYAPVFYQCRKMLKNTEDAEDAAQEILIQAYQKLKSLQEPAAYWGWLNRIAATRCVNILSRTHRDL